MGSQSNKSGLRFALHEAVYILGMQKWLSGLEDHGKRHSAGATRLGNIT
jgi:hypothetical protein